MGFSHVLSVFHLMQVFSPFPRGTSPLSASPPYLALDAHTTRSYCTTKQYYSSVASCPRAVTACGRPFHGVSAHSYNCNYHRSSFSFVRHYYRNPRLFLLLPLLICLSPGRRPASLHIPTAPRPLRLSCPARWSSLGEPRHPVRELLYIAVVVRGSTACCSLSLRFRLCSERLDSGIRWYCFSVKKMKSLNHIQLAHCSKHTTTKLLMILRLVHRPQPCYDLHLIYFSLFRAETLHPEKHLR